MTGFKPIKTTTAEPKTEPTAEPTAEPKTEPTEFLHRTYNRVKEQLKRFIKGRHGMAIVLGNVGCGKTTLTRSLFSIHLSCCGMNGKELLKKLRTYTGRSYRATVVLDDLDACSTVIPLKPLKDVIKLRELHVIGTCSNLYKPFPLARFGKVIRWGEISTRDMCNIV